MRRRIVAANWKMYKTAEQATLFFEKLKPLIPGATRCEVVIFPTTLAIPAAVETAHGTAIRIGGQNLYWGKEGAHTGEISGEMLRAAGATWALIGHSERRQYFHESDADVLKKTQAAIEADLMPII